MIPELCAEIPNALVMLNQHKFDAVIVDLQLGGRINEVVERIRLSSWNRTAVIFTISNSDTETSGAFKAGCNFVLRRPLSLSSIDRSLKVAYGMIVRERRRYFRCPVDIPATICRPPMPEIHGKAVNISEGGIAIATTVVLDSEIKVKVQFSLPGDETPFVVGATICWRKDACLGLQFTSLSPDLSSELQEWLSRRLEQSLPESVADKFRKSGGD
jgi:CheY-like chemotaxis protein